MLIILMATAIVGSDPEGAMVTAPETPVTLAAAAAAPAAPPVQGVAQKAAPHGLDTDAQIERWLASRTLAAERWPEAAPLDPQEAHGTLTVAVGTGDYREYGAAVSLPIGEHARLDLSYHQVENGYYGYRYGDWADPRLEAVGETRRGVAASYGTSAMWPGPTARR